MTKWLLILIIAGIAALFAARTWRVEHAPMSTGDRWQYVRDKIEVDEGFLQRAALVPRFESRGESFESILKRYGDAEGIPIIVRWEALEQIGLFRNTDVGPFVIGEMPMFIFVALEFRSQGPVDMGFPEYQNRLGHRCRHGTVLLSRVGNFEDDVMWRRYDVQDLIDGIAAAKIENGYWAAVQPRNNQEILAKIVGRLASRIRNGKADNSPGSLRLSGGILEAQRTLEDHISMFKALDTLRRTCLRGNFFDFKGADDVIYMHEYLQMD